MTFEFRPKDLSWPGGRASWKNIISFRFPERFRPTLFQIRATTLVVLAGNWMDFGQNWWWTSNVLAMILRCIQSNVINLWSFDASLRQVLSRNWQSFRPKIGVKIQETIKISDLLPTLGKTGLHTCKRFNFWKLHSARKVRNYICSEMHRNFHNKTTYWLHLDRKYAKWRIWRKVISL